MPDFPAAVQNDGTVNSAHQLVAWLHAHQRQIERDLAAKGAVLLRGFPVCSPQDFHAVVAAFGYPVFTYEESLSNAVRVSFTPRVFSANEAPPEVEIALHHEMAQTPKSPDILFFCCLASAESGGATPLCRSDHLYTEFQAAFPDVAQRCETLGLRYTMEMPAHDNASSGQGRSWRSTLNVEARDEAERKLEQLGYRWGWQPDGALETQTPVLPAVITLADGSKSFYNQLLAAHTSWAHQNAVTFGNGDPIPDEAVDFLARVSRERTVPLEWQDGDVAVLDNRRVMHGRYPYTGGRKRQVLASLGSAG